MNVTADCEGEVPGIRKILLNHYYPASEGYVHRPQGKGFYTLFRIKHPIQKGAAQEEAQVLRAFGSHSP